MKKSIYTFASLLMFLLTSPIFAQAEPGEDPDLAAPLDDYVGVMVLVAVSFAILKFRAIYKQEFYTTD